MKRVLLAIPLAAMGAGYYIWNYKLSKYPPEAKKYLRKALLAHDHGIGSLSTAPAYYRMGSLD